MLMQTNLSCQSPNCMASRTGEPLDMTAMSYQNINKFQVCFLKFLKQALIQKDVAFH